MPTINRRVSSPSFGAVATSAKVKKKKEFNMFRPKIRSRHPSHDILRTRGVLPYLPFKSVVRLGSTTDIYDTVTHGGSRVECNTIEGIKNSASKFLMKAAFVGAGVATAPWFKATNTVHVVDNGKKVSDGTTTLSFPVVAKLNFGSRGTGMHLIKDRTDLDRVSGAIRGRLDEYLFEEYKNYVREYRLHVTDVGCFYACRKLIKNETPDDKRWYRNDSNCTWIVETNALFDRPSNWKAIELECIKALRAVKLDIGACDVRVQSSDNATPKFIVVEINSAPSFGEITTKRYVEQLPKVLRAKFAACQRG